MRKSVWIVALWLAIGLAACSGDKGSPGAPGEPGEPGPGAVDRGVMSGLVVDAAGEPVANVTIETTPVTTPVSTGSDGKFELAGIPVGAYTVAAATADGRAAQLVVGIVGGQTTSVRLTLAGGAAAGMGRATGTVRDVKNGAVSGAIVHVQGQEVTATTGADGTFTLSGVKPGFVYLSVTAPSTAYLDGETRRSILIGSGTTTSDVAITLSGRPSDSATWIGSASCKACHGALHGQEMVAAFDGGPDAAAHSRFVVEGTSQMIHPEMWPAQGHALLPRDAKGALLMVQDPQDGRGLVNVALCTQGTGAARKYLFKFYPQLGTDAAPVSRAAADLDCAGADGDLFAWKTAQDAGTYTPTTAPVFIPVAATIGGQGNWGEGWRDPGHVVEDRRPNFGEGKQRYMCRMQDAPYLRQWAKTNGVTRWLEDGYADYIDYMPVYIMQDGTPTGSSELAPGDVGTPKFWQKSPTKWVYPENTLSRNCAGCHATGAKLTRKSFADYKEVVVDWEFKELNVGCERCHGPGSEHAKSFDPSRIISPQHMTAKAADETCGQCHGAHGGKSERPYGVFKYAFDANFENTFGNGFFVPGINELETFYFKFDQAVPTVADDWTKGSFHSWPDELHSRSHSQMLSETRRSVHSNNSFEKLTCFSCHETHTLAGGPRVTKAAGGYVFNNADYGNNAMCLACHATHGDFTAVQTADVAVLQIDAGRGVSLNGQAVTNVDAKTASLARNRVAKAVAEHMQVRVGMGGALYTPANAVSPVGNCTSCHMAKIGKLQDVDDDAQWHLKRDPAGLTAVAEGNVASHVFDIVWPAQSAVLAERSTKDHQVMPNSCGNCHQFARISGDKD